MGRGKTHSQPGQRRKTSYQFNMKQHWVENVLAKRNAPQTLSHDALCYRQRI